MGGGYDPHAPVGEASSFSTLQNLIKPFVGAGILALPSAFNEGGVLASAILMAILAVGVNFCIRCLLTSVDQVFANEHNLDYDRHTAVFTVKQEVDEAALPPSNGNGNGRNTNGRNSAHSAHSNHSSPPLLPSRSSIQNLEDSLESDDPSEPLNTSSISLDDQDVMDNVPLGTSASTVGVKTTKIVPSPAFPTDSNGVVNLKKSPPIYTFRQIGEFAYGKYGQLAVDVNLVASQVGFCIAYMSFISQNMIKVVDDLTRVEWIFVLFGGWSLLTQIRDIRKIAFTSGFGNLVYLVSIGIIFWDGFKHHCCISVADTEWIKLDGLALVFGTGCFALEGIGLILPVKRAMKNQHKFGKVLNRAIMCVAIAYIGFGVLGYLFYGSAVSSVITNNLGSGPVADAVRVSLSISLVFTYAIQMFPVSEFLDGIWDRHVFNKDDTSSGSGLGNDNNAAPSTERYQVLREDGSTGTLTPTLAAPTPVSHSSAEQPIFTGRTSPSDRRTGAASVYDACDPIDNNGNGAPRRSLSPRPSVVAISAKYNTPTNWRRECAFILTRICLVAFTGGISIVFPNFGLIVSLVGSFSNSAIAFILPQLFYIKLVLQPERARLEQLGLERTSWQIRKDYILPITIIVLGALASVVGVYTTIKDMVNNDAN